MNSLLCQPLIKTFNALARIYAEVKYQAERPIYMILYWLRDTFSYVNVQYERTETRQFNKIWRISYGARHGKKIELTCADVP
jgi:hypothetical protein